MKISFDLSSWPRCSEPPSQIAIVLFCIAHSTLEKLKESGVDSYVEVIKIGMLPEKTDSEYPFGSTVWTCILNLNGKKIEAKLIRAGSSGNLLWERSGNEDQTSKLYVPNSGFEERAVEEFVSNIQSTASKVVLVRLLETQDLCEAFGVDYSI